MSGHKKPHHMGSYHRRALRLRAAANANPATVCWRCGDPLLPDVPGKDRWTAGHLVDGQVGGALAPEHASCNYGAGAKAGNEARRTLPPSRRW